MDLRAFTPLGPSAAMCNIFRSQSYMVDNGDMRVKDARLNALGHWFLEASVLLMVFPWLDQMVYNVERFNWHLLGEGILGALISGVIGLYLIRGEN